MISVTIIATSAAGKGAELAQVWHEAGQRVLAEDAECKSFVVALSQDTPDQVIATEHYTSKAALDAHNESDLSKELLPAMMPLFGGPPTIYVADIIE